MARATITVAAKVIHSQLGTSYMALLDGGKNRC
jgi:hypothetical protein